MGKIKKIVRILVPSSLLRGKLHTLHEYYLIISARYRHQKALRKLKGKPKIKVAFFVLHSSVWKCDELYKKMDAEDKKKPQVFLGLLDPSKPAGGLDYAGKRECNGYH